MYMFAGDINLKELDLSGFNSNVNEDNEKLQEVIDDIKNKYGNNVINFANIKETIKNEHRNN